MRLIDADDFGNRMYHEAFEKDSDLQKWDSGCWIRYKLFETVLREQPTVEERKAGRWERKIDGVYCSACYLGWDFITGVPADVETKYRYCPNCGAKMEEEYDKP